MCKESDCSDKELYFKPYINSVNAKIRFIRINRLSFLLSLSFSMNFNSSIIENLFIVFLLY
jgi:hypothetical protein